MLLENSLLSSRILMMMFFLEKTGIMKILILRQEVLLQL